MGLVAVLKQKDSPVNEKNSTGNLNVGTLNGYIFYHTLTSPPHLMKILLHSSVFVTKSLGLLKYLSPSFSPVM